MCSFQKITKKIGNLYEKDTHSKEITNNLKMAEAMNRHFSTDDIQQIQGKMLKVINHQGN